MKISFNPSNSNKNILDLIKNNKDIIFDLKGHSIFARGVEFKGTDTNTWRPVVDNLTSDSTTSSLSAKQGKVLKALIDGKSNSDHNHDGRYVRYYTVTALDCNNLAAGLTAARVNATNAGTALHSAYLYISDVGTPFQIQIPDSGASYIYKRYYSSGKWSGWFKLNAGYADSAGSVAWANVTGKPSSYTPSAHTHAWNSLTHSSTTENQAILTNGSANGWKLQTLNIARWDNAANNAHSHANKSVLDGITSALVNSWNTAYNFVSNITGTDTDKVINKWEEIVNFLAGITEDNKLNTLLSSKLSVYELADKTNVGTIKNNGIYYSTTDASSSTLTNSPFNNGFALINMTSYDGGDDLRRSRLAFNAYGEIKVSDDRDQANTAETWYNVLTSKNSGINGSTIKLNGTSITVYSSGTADGRYVKKSGDTMSGVLTTPVIRVIGTSDNMAWNRGSGRIVFVEDASNSQAVSLVYTSYDSVRAPAGIRLTGSQGNEWFEASRLIKTGSNDNYVLLGAGGHILKGNANGNIPINNGTVNTNLNADLLDGYHASSFIKMKQFRFNQYKEGFWTKILTITINSTSDLQPVIAFNWIPSECAREVWAEFTINWRSNSPIFYAIWKGTAVRTLTCVNSSGNIWDVWVQGDKNEYDPFGEVQVTYAHNISSYNGGSLGYSDSDPGGTRCTLGGYVNYARSTGNADTVDGQHASAFSYKSWWHWHGKDGQPNWLWGGNNENDYYVYNPSNFRVAYAASAGNADTLDGYHANGSNDRPYGHIPTIESDGVMEVGRYIDFHNDNNGKHDFSTRLQSTGNYGNVINLPSVSGTLALINDINNYYWANVKISASSSTTTSPTVSNLTATNSIRLGNIHLEHTNEINSYGGLLINYRSSADVDLCQGGGNVCIGATLPTQKLDVRGNIITKGLGIQPYYLSKSVLLPTIRLDDGYTYKCLEISATTEISCIIADRAGLMSERGILIKFNKGYDGQIILLKDLQCYGGGNGYFWVMPSGCNIINADNSSILVGQNQISHTYDDGRSRFLIYSSVYSVWIEFLCSNTF